MTVQAATLTREHIPVRPGERQTGRVTSMRLRVVSAHSRDNQQRRELTGQRCWCLEHWSGLSSLCNFGKKHRGLLFVRFESSTNKGWKSLKHTFPEQRESPMALYSCVSLVSCLILWSAISYFVWTCVWPASLATAGEGGQQDHEHTHQYVVIP